MASWSSLGAPVWNGAPPYKMLEDGAEAMQKPKRVKHHDIVSSVGTTPTSGTTWTCIGNGQGVAHVMKLRRRLSSKDIVFYESNFWPSCCVSSNGTQCLQRMLRWLHSMTCKPLAMQDASSVVGHYKSVVYPAPAWRPRQSFTGTSNITVRSTVCKWRSAWSQCDARTSPICNLASRIDLEMVGL